MATLQDHELGIFYQTLLDTIALVAFALLTFDLQTLLLQPAAWDLLSADDKQEILSFFPADAHILDPNTPDARPNVGSLRSNDTFRHDAEEYVSNIAKGMHDLEWLRQAWVAHHRRAAGDFDEFYIRKVEVDWSTDIPDEHRPEHLRIVKSGASSSSSSSSSSEGPDNVSRTEDALKSDKSVEIPEKNNTFDDGTVEQNGSVKHTSDKPTNGNKAHTPDNEWHNVTVEVADSITVSNEQPSKVYDGPRFEVIPSPGESDVDHGSEHGSDHEQNTNGVANGMGQHITVEERVGATEAIEVDCT